MIADYLLSCTGRSLTVKNEESSGRRGDSDSKGQSDPLSNIEVPVATEVLEWNDSFDKLMKSPCGRAIFREFLKSEYSEENMLFWLACEDLKKESNPETVEEKARLIYEDYISILSPREVSLDSKVRELINRNMVVPNTSTFDEAQHQIYTLMRGDSYPRFLSSPVYKKLCESVLGASCPSEAGGDVLATENPSSVEPPVSASAISSGAVAASTKYRPETPPESSSCGGGSSSVEASKQALTQRGDEASASQSEPGSPPGKNTIVVKSKFEESRTEATTSTPPSSTSDNVGGSTRK